MGGNPSWVTANKFAPGSGCVLCADSKVQFHNCIHGAAPLIVCCIQNTSAELNANGAKSSLFHCKAIICHCRIT